MTDVSTTCAEAQVTLEMASAQVVETSVTNNSPSQDSYHPDDLFQSRYVTPPQTIFLKIIMINKTLFYAQNAGNSISEPLNFKFFWGSIPLDTPYSLLFCHSHMFYLQQSHVKKLIETHDP